MGKRIIVQRRGRGTHTYKVRRKAFRYQAKILGNISGEGEVIRLLNSPAHSAPLAKIKHDKGSFFIPAHNKMFEGQKIKINSEEVKEGNISKIGDLPLKTEVYCIEARPNDGGKFIKTGGSSARINKMVGENVFIVFPSKKEKKLNKGCRAVIGKIAGHGRLDKPILKAGKKHHMMRSKSKLWPRTSPIKMNAIDHPFGSGRGKNPKSKIAKRNAPPGARVGLIRPKRTGKRK